MTASAVSVIVATWNRAALLAQAIESVRAQTFTDWELIVADDGSTDDTREFVGDLADSRISLLALAHGGNAARARNAALGVARGKYIAFLDSDDVWLPDKLAVQIPALSLSGCRWGYTNIRRMDSEGRELPSMVEPRNLPGGLILESLLRIEAKIALPTVVAEQSLLEEMGGFDETSVHCQDYELWMRLAESGPVHVTPYALTRVRVHASHLQSDRVAVERAWVRLYTRRAESARDPSIAALCRAQRDEHLLRLIRALIARGEAIGAMRAIVGARTLWNHRAFWWEAGSVLFIPFPRGRRLVRRLLGAIRPPVVGAG